MQANDYCQYVGTIIDAVADGLMVVDPEGTIVLVNGAMEAMTGYGREELVGRSCELLDCDACFAVKSQGQEKFCALFTDGQVRHRNCTIRRRNGSRVQLLKNAAVFRDGAGKVAGGVETWTDITELVTQQSLISSLRRELRKKEGFRGIIGRSPVMEQVFHLVSNAAQSDAPVLIHGESGTGKELVASAIHSLSPRRKKPFIKVNCAALNEALLESELFGHVKGAFTGADRERTGRFEAAHGGSIFLDEVGDMPLSTQIRLLRVLQEKEIERVGDHSPIRIDVRVITATNKDLTRLIEEGRFREDLYYRINVIPVHLPPLRERRGDIPLLLDAFRQRTALSSDKPISGFTKDATELLISCDWPGNVRELINVVEYAFVVCPGGQIGREHLPPWLAASCETNGTGRPRGDEDERERVVEALAASGGNRSKAARLLGMSRVTLWKRLKKYKLA